MGELAVSFTGPLAIEPARGALRLTDLQVFVSTLDVGPPLVVQQRLWDGRLLAGVVYHDGDLEPAAVARIGADVRERLEALATTSGSGVAA